MKKRLSVLLAVILVVSMVTPVFATLPAPGDIVGPGDVLGVTIPDELIGGAIPTSGNLAFTIDPRNVLGLGVGDVFNPDARTNAVAFGSAATLILGATNTSTTDVLLRVSLAVTNDDGDANPVNATVVSTEADVTGTAARNVLFWMEPTRDNLKSAVADAAANYEAVGQVIPFGTFTSPSVAAYSLPGVPSRLVVDSVAPVVLVRERTGGVNDRNGTAFRFGGIFNSAVEWTGGAASEVRLAVTFTMTPFYNNASGDRVIGLVAESGGEAVANLLASGTNLVTATSGAYALPALIDRPAIVTTGIGPVLGFRAGTGISAIDNNWGDTVSVPGVTIAGRATLTVSKSSVVGTAIPFAFDDKTVTHTFYGLAPAATFFTVESNGVVLSNPAWASLAEDNHDIHIQLSDGSWWYVLLVLTA
jgi:hypothetical protein